MIWHVTRGWVGGLALFSVLTVACGYQFAVEGPGPIIGGVAAPSHEGPPVRLAVQDFSNNTFHPNLESLYADFVRQELATAGGTEVVFDPQESDFLLKGEIVSVEVPSLAFSNTQTQESRVTVTVRVTLQERKTGALVWGKTLVGSGDFFVGGAPDSGGGGASLQFNQVLQDRALEQAGQRIAQTLAADFTAARNQGLLTNVPADAPSSGNPDRPQ